MANVKINDLGLAAAVLATMQLETDIGGSTPNKVTAAQIKTFSNNGESGGKTIEGGTGASENLILDSTANATKGEVQISDGSTLHANTANYETLVTDDDDIPNKKYVDDSHPDTVTELLTISGDGQTAFTLGGTPTTPSESILVLNGQVRLYTTDFTISGTTLTWNDPGGLTLKTTDTLQIWYNVTMGAPMAPVTSVFSRVGVVTAQSGDYTVGQVTGAAASGANSDITSLTGLTTPLSIAQGGTNSGSALSNDRVMVSSAGAVIESATITTTELGLLNGIVSVSTGAGDNDKFVTQGYVDDATAVPTKSIFYNSEGDGNIDNYRSRSVGGSGTFRFNGRFPVDLTTVTKIVAIASPNAAAAGTGKDIDIYSSYAASGEAINNHTESDTTTTYDTGTTDNFFELDLSGIFTTPAANDMFGVLIDNNIGLGTINYYGILVEYT
jgi:hypothetical protein